MMSPRERLAMAYLRGFREAVTSRTGSTPAGFAEQPSTRSLYMDGWHAGIETRDRVLAEGQARADKALELQPKAAREAQREEMAAGQKPAPKTSTIVDIGALLTGGKS